MFNLFTLYPLILRTTHLPNDEGHHEAYQSVSDIVSGGEALHETFPLEVIGHEEGSLENSQKG